MPYLCRMGVILAVLVVVFTTYATAQLAHPLDVVIQDSVGVYNHSKLPTSWFAPSYQYAMIYGGTSRTDFIFTECKKNGELIKLMTWNRRKTISAPAEVISYNSRTVNFQVHAGDTISFFRSMGWYNPTTNHQDTNNYYALDTLEMIVHLVSAGDGRPLAQLDSIGMLPRTVPGMPAIYGTRPVLALVSYVVPEALDGDSVLVGVTLRAEGSGPHNYIRRDEITVGLSASLENVPVQEYLAAFGPIYAKRSIDELMKASGEAGAVLQASTVAGAPRDIRIRFNGPKGVGQTAVMVYDESGNLVFSPYISRRGQGESEVTYRATNAGAYFVTLAQNGRIVKTNKIIITN